MQIAMKKSKENIKNCIGKEYKVLIENISFDGKFYIGRTYMDIPETDGVVFIENTSKNLIGKFVNVEIINSKDYDLIGKVK